ncbi:MAG: DNA polymerase III subunit delta' [Syntrophobacteraceae bacterium]
MALSDIPGQQRAVRFLRQLVRKDAVPHAFLFTGMPGTGKVAGAVEFARVLECLDPRDFDACGRCPACRKIGEGLHPDLIQVRADGATIKIEQIRELRERFRFRPFEGKWRVVIIHDAQRLKEEAANALLKILEEPPRGNLFILIAPESQMLLPTIVSRCCHVRFQPLGDDIVAEYLVRESGLDPERAAEVARLSAGSLDAARRLTEEGRIAASKRVLENLERLDGQPMIDFFQMISEWVGTREEAEQDLECVRLWVRDLILLRLAGDRPLTFALDDKTKEAVGGVPPERLFLLYHGMEQAIRNLKVNANLQLTLESVCLAIKDSLYGKGDWYSFSKRRQDLPF